MVVEDDGAMWDAVEVEAVEYFQGEAVVKPVREVVEVHQSQLVQWRIGKWRPRQLGRWKVDRPFLAVPVVEDKAVVVWNQTTRRSLPHQVTRYNSP